MNYKLKKISGDASFREFYRLQKGKKTSIIVQARKEKFKNLIIYSVINDILIKHKINAPKLIHNYYEDNIIEITDLGKKSFYDVVIKKKNKLKNYKDLIKLIIKLQNIKLKQTYRFRKFKFKFETYTMKILHKESDLFFDWYLKYFLKKKKIKKIKNILKRELNDIYKKIYFTNNVFVHRDFHASNIMVYKNNYGLIDSQDAILGNPLYDVASLIDDVRIKLSSHVQEKLFNFYYRNSKLKKEKYENLKNDFDILSVQRNLKILGIFVRLYKRDGKSNYLKYLPYTWSLIEKRLKNPVFENLNYLFKKYLKIKTLNRIRNI